MKKLFTLSFIVLCFGICLNAQDIITLKNGDEIQALVQEVGDVDVKYKKFDNPNGPNYTLKKSEIFMIRYANGSRDVFATESVTPPVPATGQQNVQNNKEEVYLGTFYVLKYRSSKQKANAEDLFYDMPDALKNYRTGKILNTVSLGISVVGLSISLYEIGHIFGNETHDLLRCPIFWTSVGLLIVPLTVGTIGQSKMKTAVNLYNASIRRQQPSNISLNLGITQSGGVGFTVCF